MGSDELKRAIVQVVKRCESLELEVTVLKVILQDLQPGILDPPLPQQARDLMEHPVARAIVSGRHAHIYDRLERATGEAEILAILSSLVRESSE